MRRHVPIRFPAIALAAMAHLACSAAAPAAEPELSYSSGNPPLSARQAARRVGVRGKITRLHRAEGRSAHDGVVSTILVEGEKAADTEADKALVSLTAKTRVVRGSGSGTAAGAGTALRFADLAVGQQAEVTFAGPVRESYPVQATAAEVVVLASNGAAGNAAAPTVPAGSDPLDERGPGVTVHPLVFDPPRVPLPLVRMRVNDSEPLLFVVDTAWGPVLTLDNWVGEKLKLPKTQDTTKLNGSVPLGFVRIDSIEMVATQTGKHLRVQFGGNAVPIGDLGFLRDALGTEERVAGIIGVPLLARATARFDFAAKTLALFWQPHAPVSDPPGADATTFPMRADRADEPHFRYVSVTPVPGQSARLLIDTGATMTSLPGSVTARLKPAAAHPTISQTASSLYLEERLLLDELRLGERRAERLVVVHSDNAGDEGENTGLLGMDLLARFRVTLDFRNERLTLERPPDYGRRVRVPGETGVGLHRDGAGYRVSDVAKGSPARKAGVRPGDRIVSVDGVDIAPFSENVAIHILNGFAGAPAALVVERPADGSGGPGETPAGRLTVRFVRASAFAGPPEPRRGVMFKRPAAGRPFVVTHVAPGSPAERAGLRLGETIVTLNGVATGAMTPSQLQQELGKGEWALEVRAEADKAMRLLRIKI